MSDTTDRLGLYMPEGEEDVSVTTDLNGNLLKIDTNINFRVAANATARLAIESPWEGLSVRETDTGDCYVSNGSSPGSGSWTQLVTATTSVLTQVGVPSITALAVDSTRTSTTTLTNDSVLTTTLEANSKYLIELMLIIAGHTDGDMNSQYSYPSGATGTRSVLFYGDTLVGAAAGYTANFNYLTSGISTNNVAWENTVMTTTSAGTFALKWAQLASNATATSLKAGTWMRVTKIA